MAHLPTDAVKAAAQRAVTRVITALVDPGAAAHQAVAEVRQLPRTAARLPLQVALGGLTAVERLRSLRHRGASTPAPVSTPAEASAPLRAATPARDSAASSYAAADTEGAALARGAEEAPLAEQVDALLDAAGETSAPSSPVAPVRPLTAAPTKAVPARAPAVEKAPAEAAPAEAAPATPSTGGTVTPIHAGRDGHREVELSAAAEAAVEAAPEGATLTSGDLPLAGYDGMSLAQVRSRLSKLDVVQLAQLRDYERAHADRTPVVTMLENRLAKVAEAPTGGPAAPVPAPPTTPPAAPATVTPATAVGDAAPQVGGKPGRDPRS